MLLAGIQANCGVAIRLRTKSEQAEEKNNFAKLAVWSDLGMQMSRMSSTREAQIGAGVLGFSITVSR